MRSANKADLVNLKPLAALPKRLATDPKYLCGAGRVPAYIAQNPLDIALLDRAEGRALVQRDAPRVENVCGDIGPLESLTSRQNRAVLDDALELPHVSRPRVSREYLERIGGESTRGAASARNLFFKEEFRERNDVVGPLPKRWKPNPENTETMEQVAAKEPSLHGLFEIGARGGDEARLELDGLCPAEPLESTLLDRTQELGLVERRKFANLVQKQRALAGKLKFSCFSLSRAGKRATLVAEELALEQALGNARKVDRDHGKSGPLSPQVQRMRREVFSCTALPAQNDIAGRDRETLEKPDDLHHLRIVGDDRGI